MFSNNTLESTYGPMDFVSFEISIWLKIYIFFLWTLVVLSNLCCLIYIYQKLNLSNIVNLIPLLDCTLNLVGFLMIGIFSANFWCNEVGIIAACLLISGKSFHLCHHISRLYIFTNQSQVNLILGHLTYCLLSMTRYVIVRNGHDSQWIGMLKKSLLPSHLALMIYWLTIRVIYDNYIRSLNGALEVSIA